MAGREVDAALAECGGDKNENERGEGKKMLKRKKGKKREEGDGGGTTRKKRRS